MLWILGWSFVALFLQAVSLLLDKVSLIQSASPNSSDCCVELKAKIDILVELGERGQTPLTQGDTKLEEVWTLRLQGFLAGVFFWAAIDLLIVVRSLWQRTVRRLSAAFAPNATSTTSQRTSILQRRPVGLPLAVE